MSARPELTPEQQAEVRRLKATDRQVRQHEQAHIAAAGGYARGGASYSYTTGPDGKQYATGGEVSIDTSPARTPEATIQKMETVKRAAVAPANPSSQDRAVYAQAQQAESAAKQEMMQEGAGTTGSGSTMRAATVAGYENTRSAAERKLGQNLNVTA